MNSLSIFFIMAWNIWFSLYLNCCTMLVMNTCVVVQGNNSGAYRELVTCLRVLQCPLPVTRLEVCSALFWQMLRQVLHRLYIGRWLSSYSGGLFATPYVSLSKLKHYIMVIHTLQQSDNYTNIEDALKFILWLFFAVNYFCSRFLYMLITGLVLVERHMVDRVSVPVLGRSTRTKNQYKKSAHWYQNFCYAIGVLQILSYCSKNCTGSNL